jgi:cystathionine beta-lyase/cystathionine gamma-synthase
MDDLTSKEDICAHLGDDYSKFLGAIVPPIFQNSLFTRKQGSFGYVYTRVNNPTTEIAEKKIAALEGGEEAKCFSSGMGAISAAIMLFVASGDHIITLKSVYTPVRVFFSEYLKKFNIEVTFVSGNNIEDFQEELKPNTKLIYLESPSSNIFSMQNLEEIAELAKSRDIKTIIDNTWATPIYQNPLRYGIDVVVHSASKYMGGHSDIIGGVAIGKKEYMEHLTHYERSIFGACMDPHQAWLLLRGLRTLPLRMKQHSENALIVARFLEGHNKIEKVLYPGLESHEGYELGKSQMCGYSGLMSFIPKEKEPSKIMQVVKSLRFFEEGPSWGGFESIINTPGVGISEEASNLTGNPNGLVRISVGLEDVNSILNDLDRALNIL